MTADPPPPALHAVALPAPWYRSDLFRWGVSLALGFALSWLSSHGITPAPLPSSRTSRCPR